MPRRHVADFSRWPSLNLEGNLIAPAMLSKISAHDAPEQSPEDYSVRKGLTLREEISTAFRVGQSRYEEFRELASPNHSSTIQFVQVFLREAFGFNDTNVVDGSVPLVAGDRTPIVVVPPSELLDQRSQILSSDRSRSASSALQDHLNESSQVAWGLVTNGNKLRLMRNNASMTRPAYIEVDIEQMFQNEDISSFAALWLLIHRSRFESVSRPATECSLEVWRNAGAAEGDVARDRLADQVKDALICIGSGMLEANPNLRGKLASGEIDIREWFNELLRIVYRLIFIMVAEDRNLLHLQDADIHDISLYSDGYSLTKLRKRCIRAFSWNQHFDVYEGVKVIFHSLANGEPSLGLPALGGLFDEDKLRITSNKRLPNHAFMKALSRLSWLSDGRSRITPINWKAMETEELGSVYESLLELQPQLGEGGLVLQFASDVVEKRGNQKKTTGSYYTPDSLVQMLLNSTLDPVLSRIEKSCTNSAESLLSISVIDPACGSGHFLLGAARRIATRVAKIRCEENPNYREAMRDVVSNCIYGVDINPMAVELAKVALWIETVEPGRPLGYLDSQIRCGDSLLGVFDLDVLRMGISDDAYSALFDGDKATANYYKRRNRSVRQGQREFIFDSNKMAIPEARYLAVDFSKIRKLPENSLAQISQKDKKFRKLRKEKEYLKLKLAADLYISAFLCEKNGDVSSDPIMHRVPTTEDVWAALSNSKSDGTLYDLSVASRKANAFHWPLEFPNVVERGGFDVVVGNPPWDRIKFSHIEFFAARLPQIALAQNAAERGKMIDSLKSSANLMDKNLYEEYRLSRRRSKAISRFTRVDEKYGGRFSKTGRGDVNTYALFTELAFQLTSISGHAGIIVPTGIATDLTTAPFFSFLMNEKKLFSLFDYINSAPLFHAVDRSYKFCLISLSHTSIDKDAKFAFFLTNPGQADEVDRNVSLTSSVISKIHPNTKTSPLFRSCADRDLTIKIRGRVPVLVDERVGNKLNPWGISMMCMFHMAGDSELFRTATQLEKEGFVLSRTNFVRNKEKFIPLYEAKMIHQFDHRWSGYVGDGSTPLTSDSHSKSSIEFEPLPRYWVCEKRVNERLDKLNYNHNWLIGWRDIAGTTRLRTVIATAIPRYAVGHSMPLLFSTESIRKRVFLLANLNSIVLDYIARQSVNGNHVTYFYLKQFAVLAPDFCTELRLDFVVSRTLKLIYTSNSMKPFAEELGYSGQPYVWNDRDRAVICGELDAFFAKSYGLSREDLCYILDPASVKGVDYPTETFRVLKNAEIKKYGTYLTQELTLEAWDRMLANGEFSKMGI